MKIKEFSKKLLFADYIIAIMLILGYFICVGINGLYAKEVIDSMLDSGIDISCVAIPQLFTLDGFAILLTAWITQLGISSGAYYILCKSDHKIQLPIRLLNDLPNDIKDKVDCTQIITTVLTTTDN